MLLIQVSAQKTFYGAAGYNLSIMKSEGLDYVVDRYNATRSYLDDQMDYMHYYDGIHLAIGAGQGPVLITFGFTQRQSKSSASGKDQTGTVQQRDLKNKWNTYDMGIAFGFNSDHLGLYLGCSMGINAEKTLTRVGSADEVGTANFEKVNSQYKAGFDPYISIAVPMGGAAFIIKPYFSWTPVKTDYYKLNQFINPYTYANDPVNIEGRLTGYGCTISLGFYDYSE